MKFFFGSQDAAERASRRAPSLLDARAANPRSAPGEAPQKMLIVLAIWRFVRSLMQVSLHFVFALRIASFASLIDALIVARASAARACQ